MAEGEIYRNAVQRLLDPIADLSPIGSAIGDTPKYQMDQAIQKEQYKSALFKDKERAEQQRQFQRNEELFQERKKENAFNEEQRALQRQESDAARARADMLFRQKYIQQVAGDTVTNVGRDVALGIQNDPAYQSIPTDAGKQAFMDSRPVRNYNNMLSAMKLYMDGQQYGVSGLTDDAVRLAKEAGLNLTVGDDGKPVIWDGPGDDAVGFDVTPESVATIRDMMYSKVREEANAAAIFERRKDSVVGSAVNDLASAFMKLQNSDKGLSYSDAGKSATEFMKNGKYTPEEMRQFSLIRGIENMVKNPNDLSENQGQELLELADIAGIKYEMTPNGVMVKADNGNLIAPQNFIDSIKQGSRLYKDFSNLMDRSASVQAGDPSGAQIPDQFVANAFGMPISILSKNTNTDPSDIKELLHQVRQIDGDGVSHKMSIPERRKTVEQYLSNAEANEKLKETIIGTFYPQTAEEKAEEKKRADEIAAKREAESTKESLRAKEFLHQQYQRPHYGSGLF